MYGTFSYTPDQSGTVFAELYGFQAGTGSYTLELSRMVAETGEPRGTTILLQFEQSNGADDYAQLVVQSRHLVDRI